MLCFQGASIVRGMFSGESDEKKAGQALMIQDQIDDMLDDEEEDITAEQVRGRKFLCFLCPAKGIGGSG